MLELRHALSCVISGGVFLLLSPEQVLALADGLVELEKKTGLISFFHPIVDDYVRRLPSPMSDEAWYFHEMIAFTCVTYLVQVARSNGICQNAYEFEEVVRQQPFLKYAAREWALQAKACPVECPSISLILNDRLAAQVLSQTTLIMDNTAPEAADEMVELIDTFTELEMAAYLGLSDLVSHLVAKGFSVNKTDSYGRTPLIWAAVAKSMDTVKILCEHDTITLSLLIDSEETTLIPLLISSGYNINTTDALRRTPLHLAIMLQLHGVISTLIDAKADVNVRDIKGVSPLMLAVELRDYSTVDLLLTNNADTRALHFNEFRLMLLARPMEIIGIFKDREGGNSRLRRVSYSETWEAVSSRTGRCVMLV